MHHPVVLVPQNRHYVSNNSDKLMCLLALFDEQDANSKSVNNLKNNVATSITAQLGYLGSCCSIF